MNRQVTSLLLVVTGSLGIWASSESTAHAYLFPFCHGWCHGQSAYYPPAYYPPSYGQPSYCPPAPCQPATCQPTVAYRPVWSLNPFTGFVAYQPYYTNYGGCAPACPSACSPCGSACGSSCATCSSGSIGGGSTPRTMIDEGGTDSEFRPPAESGAPRTFLDDGQGDMTDSFKVPRTSSPENPQPAPIRFPDDDSGRLPDGAGGENGDAAGSTNPAGNGTLRVPPLDVDSKVTWRALTSHKRVTIRSQFSTPTIARTRVDANPGWVPVRSETRIVSK